MSAIYLAQTCVYSIKPKKSEDLPDFAFDTILFRYKNLD